MKYVIIGNSAAAVGCIEGIRSVDSFGEITVISAEKYHTYSRPLISYLLCGKTDEEKMKYRSADFYEKNKCRCVFGVSVTKINSEEKTLTLSDGSEEKYDKLLVATGSSPFIPPMKGLENVKNKFTFMSLDDALSLQEQLSVDKNVLIVGAGLIGLKCAEGIYGRCNSITVVDLADRVMVSVLDSQSSDIVKKHIEEKGIRIILSDSVSEFKDNTAVLKSGKTVDFDMVVIAVGVRPETKLVSDYGGEVRRGIVTDEKMQTSVPDIFAAGDCTESHDITDGKDKILALLPNAYMQGEVAGVNMAGGEKLFGKAIPMNSIGFFGLHIITAGTYSGDGYEEYTESDGKNYKRLVYGGDCLKGFILVGDVGKAGIYTSMIREQMKLSELDFDSIKKSPSLIAMDEGYRKLKLSAVKRG